MLRRWVAFVLLAGVLRVSAEPSAAEAMRLAREGAKAAEANDTATYLAKMEAAAALRPDFPRILVNLAAAQVAADKIDDALATLNRFAALGLTSPIDKAPEFERLREHKDFKEIVKRLAANGHPKGKGEIAFSLQKVTGLIEGIAWREKTGDFYFGDVNGRAVWIKNKDDTLRRFTPEGDELWSVFGLAIDEAAGALWAATSAVPAMRGFSSDMDGTAGLAEVDLATGAIRRVIPLVRAAGDQQSHVLGDVCLASDGTVYVTDSGGPTLWRLSPGGQALERAVESDEFLSLQGIVLAKDGGFVLSDHASGLLRVEAGGRGVRRIEGPLTSTLIGLDGLTRTATGEILAIQNGLRPPRVLRIRLDDAEESAESVVVVEGGHLQMAAPSLGCLGPGGDFYFIGNAGWARFEEAGAEPTPPRPVPIYKVVAEKKPKPAK